MLSLSPCHSLFSLQFLWNIFFFCATSSHGLGACIISLWQGHLLASPTTSSVSPSPHPSCFVHLHELKGSAADSTAESLSSA